MENLKDKSIKAYTWDFFGSLASQIMALIFSIFLARLLEPAEFGLIAMVMVIVGVAGVFTDIGLGGALIQRRKVLPVHYSSVFYFNVSAGFLLTLITYLSAGWVGDFYKNDDLVPIAQVMSLTFLINAFSNVKTIKLRKELEFGVLTKLSFIASFASGVVGVILAANGGGVWSLVAQALSMGIVFNVLIWSVSQWKPSFLFSVKALKQLWGFGFRMFLAGMIEAIYTRLDYLIIGKLFLPETLGYFYRAKSLNLMVVKYSSGSLMSVLFPVLAQVKNNLPRFKRIVIKTLGVINFLTFLLLGCLFLISEELITLLFGYKWLPSVHFFQLLILSGFAYPIGSILVNVLHSRGKSKLNLRLQIYKKLILTSAFLVLYIWGVDMYLYSLIIVLIINSILNIFFVSRDIDIPMYQFILPIIYQAVISILSVMIVLHVTIKMCDCNAIELLMFKGFLYTVFYFLISRIFRTSSSEYFLAHFIPIFINILYKIKHLIWRRRI